MKCRLRTSGLHTVCEEARCPNIGECFSSGTATFLIMGDTCTRGCAFCAVRSGEPRPLDPGEPARVAEEVAALGLRHAVVTSVTRDDLEDGGAAHFAATIAAIRGRATGTTVEILTPDFQGREASLAAVCDAAPDVLNHNLETVRRITPAIRSGASYERSLRLLTSARRKLAKGLLKSGLMVGLGERDDEVAAALKDLREAGCDLVTIGQYLAPSRSAAPVVRFVPPEAFDAYAAAGNALGLRVLAGPLVRSSYLAEQLLHDGRTSLIKPSPFDRPRR